MFRCWDSSAVITSKEHSRSIDVSKTGDIDASAAASLMLGNQVFYQSICDF